MAQGHDTDVQLSVGLSLEDITTQSRRLANSVEKVFSKNVDSSKLTSQMNKLLSTMSKTESQIQSTILSIESLQEKAEHAQAYEDILDAIGPAREQMKEFTQLLKEATEAGDTEAVAHWTEELNASREGISEMEEALTRLEALGHDTFTETDLQRLSDYKNKLGDLNNQQRLNLTAFEGLQEQQQREIAAAEEAARIEKEHAEAIERIREAAGEMNPAISDTINKLHELEQEEAQLNERLSQLREADVAESGYTEYDGILVRLQQIEAERQQANALVRQYNQEQFDALSQQQTMEDRLRELEDERARAQERQIAILRGELNPEIATMVDRYNQVGSRIRGLEAELQHMSEQGLGYGYSDYDNTVRQLEQLRHEYSELQRGIDQYAQSLSYEEQERQRLEATAQQMRATAERENVLVAQMSDRYRELGDQLEELRRKQQELAEQGLGAGYKEYDELTRAISSTQKEYDELGESIAEYNSKLANSAGVTKDGTNAAFGLADILQGGLQRAFTLIGGKIKNFISSLSQGSSATRGFGNNFKTMMRKILAYGIGIASITSLFNKIRGAISSGITSIAKMSGGLNSTNVAMTQLTSSLNLMKGALATAFVPILTTVSPILSNFMQQLANVITFIGMFIAKLTGAKSYMKAVYKETDYASSQSKGGSKGKTAQEKYEEAVKKAQKKYDEQVAKTTEKNANAQAKAEEKQAKAAKKLAEQQEKANKQLAGFDELNVLATEDMEELEEVQADVYDMPELELPNLEDFTGSGGGGGADPFGLEEVPLDGIEWNWDDIKAKAEELGRGIADKLNKFFGNENFARELGRNIAEALNTALHFVYGFVDELDWKQLGHWLGALVDEGVKTFEWDLLGTTIGKTLNGIAESIIGFFERYPAGSLGASLATMFNHAIDELKPDEIGEAIGDIIAEPLVEITSFIDNADIEEATRKVFEIFETVLTTPLLDTDNTLGYIVGKALASLINAAFEIVMGADISGAVAALRQFITDIFIGALENINIISYVESVAIYILNQAQNVYDKIIFDIRGILTALSYIPGEIGNLAKQGVEALNSVDDKFDETKQSVHELADTYREQLPSSIKEAKDAILENSDYIKIQNKEVINDLKDTSDELALKAHSVSERIKKDADDTSDKLDTTANDGKNHINSLTDALNSSKDAVTSFSSSSATALDEVDAKTGEVSVNFGKMTSEVQAQLEAVNGIIQTWYDTMIQTYFSEEAWNTLLTDGITTSLTTFFTGEFATTWDTLMQEWWDNHVKQWFDGAGKWQPLLYSPWLSYTQTQWSVLMKWFDSMMKSWWSSYITPYFEKSKWLALFNVILSAAQVVMPQVRDEFASKINEAADSVIEACGKMEEAISNILDLLESAVEMAGQLSEIASSFASSAGSISIAGHSSGGGGGYSRGGSSRSTGLMPALEIMHFEDNLGMSAFQFPELATGAVIPPNKEFLAVLGDQKSGTNVEAPLETIKQALAEVMMIYGNNQDIVVQIDGYEVFRAVRNQSEQFRNSTGYDVL